MDDPAKLAETARAAKATGKPDAAERLADLVEGIAAGKPVSALKEGPNA